MLLTDPTLRSEGNLTELGETKTFTLKANAKAFRLLIDGLYSDKIKAPIRELATNAYDAHLEAGIPETPFEIHLPSLLDLTFQVRDFGLSMSHDQVMNLYTTMFGSTKDQSNEQVGGFGIGSKSPFAYTDTFSVTCYSGTERRDYFAHLGTDGVPALTHLETSPCSEPRGTRVSMPVNQHDRWDFRTRWMTLREGFDVEPWCSEDLPSREEWRWTGTLADGTRWSARPADYAQYSIVQGCVAYPSPLHQRMGLKVQISVPIGTFGVAATREALESTSESDDRLDQVLRLVHSALLAQCHAEIDNAKTWRLAHAAADRLVKIFGEDYGPGQIYPPTWHGRPLHKMLHSSLTLTRGDGQVRNTFTPEELDKMRLVVIRPNQTIPRMKLRLAAYRRGQSMATWTVTAASIKPFIKTLGLDPAQIVPLATIPDVEVKPRKKGAAVRLKGVYSDSDHDIKLGDLDGDEYYLLRNRTQPELQLSRFFTTVFMGEIATLLPVVSVIKTQEHRLAKLGCQPLTEAVLTAAAEQHRAEAQQYLDQSELTTFGILARSHLGWTGGLDESRSRVVVKVLGLEASKSDWCQRYPLAGSIYNKHHNDAEIFRYMRLIDADLTSVTP